MDSRTPLQKLKRTLRPFLRPNEFDIAKKKIKPYFVTDKYAREILLGTDVPVEVIEWEEENRAEKPAVHIADSGTRYSTLTGIDWLDSRRFIVNHRNGLRFAVFDLDSTPTRIATFPIPAQTDDLAINFQEKNCWEVAISGCWAAACYTYRSSSRESIDFTLVETLEHKSKDFSHGVGFGPNGELCLTYHTGVDIRIEINGATSRLTELWGVRDICYSYLEKAYFAVAVTACPQKRAYYDVMTSVWRLADGSTEWEPTAAFIGVHSDTCACYGDRLFIPDQKNDRVLGLNQKTCQIEVVYRGKELDFPHGLGINSDGKIGITNYGSSAITLWDLEPTV